MLQIDYRDGSKDLIDPLRRIGLDVVETSLEFADIEFYGRGEKGKEVTVGIEYKKLPDLLDSLTTNRLTGHQLLGMRGAEPGEAPRHDFGYLLIEGTIYFDDDGRLLQPSKRWRGQFDKMKTSMRLGELLKRIFVLHLQGGLTPIWSSSPELTHRLIEALYRVWTDQDLDQHKSHLAIYQAPTLIPVSDFRRTINTFPGLALRRSAAAQAKFGSITAAVNATVAEWAELETPDEHGKMRKLGMTTAENIVRYLTHDHTKKS